MPTLPVRQTYMPTLAVRHPFMSRQDAADQICQAARQTCVPVSQTPFMSRHDASRLIYQAAARHNPCNPQQGYV